MFIVQGATNPLARLPGASENDVRASISQSHLPDRASGCYEEILKNDSKFQYLLDKSQLSLTKYVKPVK